MTDNIKSSDTKADIDFYKVGETHDHSTELHLDLLKQGVTHKKTKTSETNHMKPIVANASWFWWLLFFAALCFVVFNGYALGITVIETYETSPFLALLMAVSATGFIGMIGYGIIKEIIGFMSLKQLNGTLNLDHLRQQNNSKLTIQHLKDHAKIQRKSKTAASFNHRFFASLQPHHTNEDVINMYLSNVEAPLLRQAQAILKQEAIRSGGASFISPNELIQTLTLLWTNLRVLRLIGQLYGLKPGRIGNLKLLGMMWQNVLLQNATDALAEQLVKDISHKFLGTIAEKAGVAATSGGLTIRLGLQLIKQLSLLSTKKITAEENSTNEK